MKTKICAVLALLTLAFNALCQDRPREESATFCHSLPVENVREVMYAPREGGYPLGKETSFDRGLYVVRIRYHIVRRSNGTGGRRELDVRNSMTFLKSAFNPHGICFSYRGFDYIDNDDYYDWNANNSYSSLVQVNNDPACLNIYVLDKNNQTNGGVSNGFLFGGVPNNNSVVVGGMPLYEESFVSYILSHEVGHVLGLFHTFETVPCTEYVNGSNCTTCGDLVCDTRASIVNIYSSTDNNCQYVGNATDPNGQSYNPDPKNIMEYSYPRCMAYFTSGQGARMRSFLSSHAQLQPILVPYDVSISSIPLSVWGAPVQYKALGTVTTTGTAYVIGFGDLTLAAGKEITINPGFNTQAGAKVDMHIEGNDCNAAPSIVNLAKMTTASTDVPTPVEPITLPVPQISPVPFTSFITIDYTLAAAGPVTLSLTDLYGREVRTTQLVQETGTHTTRIDALGDLAPGLYLVRICHNGECINQKILKAQ